MKIVVLLGSDEQKPFRLCGIRKPAEKIMARTPAVALLLVALVVMMTSPVRSDFVSELRAAVRISRPLAAILKKTLAVQSGLIPRWRGNGSRSFPGVAVPFTRVAEYYSVNAYLSLLDNISDISASAMVGCCATAPAFPLIGSACCSGASLSHAAYLAFAGPAVQLHISQQVEPVRARFNYARNTVKARQSAANVGVALLLRNITCIMQHVNNSFFVPNDVISGSFSQAIAAATSALDGFARNIAEPSVRRALRYSGAGCQSPMTVPFCTNMTAYWRQALRNPFVVQPCRPVAVVVEMYDNRNLPSRLDVLAFKQYYLAVLTAMANYIPGRLSRSQSTSFDRAELMARRLMTKANLMFMSAP